MVKDLIETRGVHIAVRRLVAVQKARRQVDRSLRKLEASLPGLESDALFDMAMNQRTPREWLRMSPAAIERVLAIELGLKPVPTARRRPKPR